MDLTRTPRILRLEDVEDATRDAIPDEATMRRLALLGYGLLTMEIFYRMPDHPSVLNTFMWQFHDVNPHFPRMKAFLSFWEKEIEAVIHSVRYAHDHMIAAAEMRIATPIATIQ